MIRRTAPALFLLLLGLPGVLATHVGPGAWAIFYQVEDGPGGGPAGRDEGTQA